jgi:hypothetical protein
MSRCSRRERARQPGITVSYKTGSFDSTVFDPSTFDAAMSVDVIWAILDAMESPSDSKPGSNFAFANRLVSVRV